MFNIDIESHKKRGKKSSKELEFFQTEFTEVTTEKEVGVAFGAYGVRKNGILYVNKLQYSNDDIKLLKALKGKYLKKKIILDGNISLDEATGYYFTGEHAVYEKKSGILHITSPFVLYHGNDRMVGSRLKYDTHKKSIEAQNVHAILYMADKKVRESDKK